ncbi:MAG: cyclase family protein [Chloroflexi bacterium]|nr:cyclase family protein [Chloroflexota bacterium]
MIDWRGPPTNYIDISVALHPDIPRWPGTPGFRLEWFKRLEAGDGCNNSRLDIDVHVGTHVDAPLHFVRKGKTVEQLALDVLIGPAQVVYLPDVTSVTAAVLSALTLPSDTTRLLLRTRNSAWWATGVQAFQPDFVALTEDAARWVVEHKIHLIGVDYLSVQRYQDGPAVHQILLGAEVVVVEGLNLAGVEPGQYELICLPLKIVGAEGAPARAVLVPKDPNAGRNA